VNRNLLAGIGIGLFVGFLGGYFIGSALASETVPVAAAAPAAAPGAPLPVNPLDLQDKIKTAEAVLAADPKNVAAWIDLGNAYFDLHQAEKSVEAYGKALALNPANADVLTDQGVMYRALKQFDKAIGNFRKAGQVDPKHQHCLYNLGVVYSEDLKKPAEAIKAWNQVIAIDPSSAQANQARQAIAMVGAQPHP
jgi:cytochrome c-type biogenesis protein CcmH/NrfG